jgi:hypothetical protein
MDLRTTSLSPYAPQLVESQVEEAEEDGRGFQVNRAK